MQITTKDRGFDFKKIETIIYLAVLAFSIHNIELSKQQPCLLQTMYVVL